MEVRIEPDPLTNRGGLTRAELGGALVLLVGGKTQLTDPGRKRGQQPLRPGRVGVQVPAAAEADKQRFGLGAIEGEHRLLHQSVGG